MLLSSWSIVVRRATADRLMLVAAAATILLATTVVSASPIYADAVSVASLHRVLADSESGANVTVTARTRGATFEAHNRIVRDQAAVSFASTGAEVVANVRGGAFQLPGEVEGLVNLASVQYIEGIERRATLTEGRWAGGDAVELAVMSEAAVALGINLGDRIELQSRHQPTLTIAATVVGFFTIDDFEDPYWRGDPMVEFGVEQTPSFRYYGPFLADLSVILEMFSIPASDMRWQVLPDHTSLEVSGIGAMREAVETFEDDLNSQVTVTGNEFTVVTDLHSQLAFAEQSIVSTRSSVMMLSVQLAILGGFAIVHTAGLLVDSRRTETGLLRARGTSNRQILTLSAMEGVLLTLPAMITAPFLATVMLRSLGSFGPLASIGLQFEPVVNLGSYLLAVLAALVCIFALVVPAYRSSRTFNESLVAQSRQPPRSIAQRVGLDVALLVLAVVAYWQLATTGVQLGSTIRDRVGLDPLLVAAPALGIMTGAVLALRVVPMVARLGERIAARGTTPVPALSAWQVARRPRRYARSSLLLILAVSVGFFASAYTASWIGSQADQAAFQIGADLRVSPNRAVGSMHDFHLRTAHESVEGVSHSMPVILSQGQLLSRGGVTRFFVLDAATAADVVTIRDDLGGYRFAEMMSLLVEDRPSLGNIELPGEPEWLHLEASVSAPRECGDLAPDFWENWAPPPPGEFDRTTEGRGTCLDPRLTVVVQDAHGFLHRLEAGRVAVNGATAVLTVRLTDPSGVGPAYPVSLVAIDLATPAPQWGHLAVRGELEVGVSVSDGPDDARTPIRLDGEWSGRRIVLDSDPRPTAQPVPATITQTDTRTPDLLGFAFNTGTAEYFDATPMTFSMRPPGTEFPEVISMVVSESFLEETGSEVGDVVSLGGFRVRGGSARIVGTIKRFPTVTSETEHTAILDLPGFMMVLYDNGANLDRPTEYWLDVDAGDAASASAALRDQPINSLRVRDQFSRARALSSDPMALSTIAALTLGFVAAAAFAVIGFTISTVILARERRTEFTLLRALGLSGRELRAWLVTEQGALVGVSLLFGSLIGFVLSAVVLPLITVTQGGNLAMPPAVVVYPARAILWVQLTVVLILLVIVLILSAVMRRRDVASQLRVNDD